MGSRRRFCQLLSRTMICIMLALSVFQAPALLVSAAPAYKAVRHMKQPDGRGSFDYILKGDEWFQYYVTPGGDLIQQDGRSNIWKYVYLAEDGALYLGDRAESDPSVSDLCPAGELAYEEVREQYYALAGRVYAARTYDYGEPVVPSGDDPATFGLDGGKKEEPLLTIVIGFLDQPYDESYDWAEKIYHSENSIGDYYDVVSGGQFTFAPAVESYANPDEQDGENDGIVHVRLDRTHGSWGSHPYNSELEQDMIDMFEAALRQSDSYVDFQAYDTNRNQRIDRDELAILFIVAGYESSYSGISRQGIWAHRWAFEDTPYDNRVVLDGIEISDYTCIGEMISDGNDPACAEQAPIGTPTHELGHYLGLPDLYDITYSDETAEWYGHTPGALSLMDGGSWSRYYDDSGKEIFIPVYLDPWSRIQLGYITPEIITESGDYRLGVTKASDSDSYQAYKIPIPGKDPDEEYYLVENRQYLGYDRGLEYGYGEQDMDGGIVVWHIDESICREYDMHNMVNTPEHRPGVTPVYQDIDDGTLFIYPFLNQELKSMLDGGIYRCRVYDGDKKAWSYYAPIEITTGHSRDAEGAITIHVNLDAYKAVESIADIPGEITAGRDYRFKVKASPSDATNRDVRWSVVQDDKTGAVFSGNLLRTEAAGTIQVRATVVKGLSMTEDYIRDYQITVKEPETQGVLRLDTLQQGDIFYSGTKAVYYSDIVIEATPSDATPSDATPSDATPSNATPSDAVPVDAAPEYVKIFFFEDEDQYESSFDEESSVEPMMQIFEIDVPVEIMFAYDTVKWRVAEHKTYRKMITAVGQFSNSYTIQASSTGGGQISPEGAVEIEEGQDQSFYIDPYDGYRIESVMVDGVNVGPVSLYSFENVNENHTIQARFARIRVNHGSGSSGDDDGTYRSSLPGSSRDGGGIWVQDGGRWRLAVGPNEYAADTWKYINGHWYHFDAEGYAQTKWQLIGGLWYYLDEQSCAMRTGWLKDPADGHWYLLAEDGSLVSGWYTDPDGQRYYLQEAQQAAAYRYDEETKQWRYQDNGVTPYGAWVR